MYSHDPVHFSTSLSSKLAARSRHVCAFVGAGVSRACGLPDLAQLRELVLTKLPEADRELFIAEMGAGTLEQGLSRLRRVASLLRDGQELDGLTKDKARNLDKELCSLIAGELNTAQADLAPANMLAAWAAHSSYLRPLEIFTVNYDLILETAFEQQKVPYFDGFIGTMKARFYTDLVENSGVEQIPSFFVRLWKLHGSVNWGPGGPDDRPLKEIVRYGSPVQGDAVAAIYPSDEKYEESRRVPFVVLQDRFRRSLNEPETLAIITGYSFGDAHLNEFIYDAARRRERSEFVVFCYAAIPEELAEKASTTPNLQVVSGSEAILGGVRANWKAPGKPFRFWVNDKFCLPDFEYLARYLALISSQDVEENA